MEVETMEVETMEVVKMEDARVGDVVEDELEVVSMGVTMAEVY